MLVPAWRAADGADLRRQRATVLAAGLVTLALGTGCVVLPPLFGVFSMLPYASLALLGGTLIYAYGVLRVGLLTPRSVIHRVRLFPVSQQVLANLILNAREAGSPTVAIEISARDESIELVIADRGHGMEADVVARAFEPFFTTRAPGDGTGLGLAVCRDIVQRIGGRIDLDSEPDRGTRVRITLPLAEA